MVTQIKMPSKWYMYLKLKLKWICAVLCYGVINNIENDNQNPYLFLFENK